MRQMKQYIHAHGQFLNMNGRMGNKIYPGNIVENQITFVDVHMLQKKDAEGRLMCTREKYDDCIYGTMERLMMDTYNCTSPWVINQKICEKGVSVYRTYLISRGHVTNQLKDCLPPCNFLMVTVGARNFDHYENVTYSIQRYSFPQRILLTEENYLYLFLTLAAEIGGYVGLLLGVSFMHGSSAIDGWIQVKINKCQQ